MHKYPGRKADHRVSSEDEEYDNEADADGMTGGAQLLVCISETVDKGVRYGFCKIDKLNTERSAISGRICDASGQPETRWI